MPGRLEREKPLENGLGGLVEFGLELVNVLMQAQPDDVVHGGKFQVRANLAQELLGRAAERA